jgi:hypothetical protein
MHITVIINRPGLLQQEVMLSHQSTAALDERLGASRIWRVLVIDGRTYPLAMMQHIEARPELEQAAHLVLRQVNQVIYRLRTCHAQAEARRRGLTHP